MNSSQSSGQRTGLEVAIVGMAGRFPGAASVDEFWRNLCAGVESIKFFSDEELDSQVIDEARSVNYIKAKGVLEGVEMFDAFFFGFSPREAEIMDPQRRIFLECAWESLEHAGYDPHLYKGRIGVFAGAATNRYVLNIYSHPEFVRDIGGAQIWIANEKDLIPSRVSYQMNLKGPSVCVQSACSTSLVAVHLAIQSLLSGECEMALSGGISAVTPQNAGYLYMEGGPFSPDGHCRAFDADARGTIGGSGVGIVVLKRLDDALADGDTIHAIIKGSAINNDGASKVGYAAPSVEGQAKVIMAAQLMSEVEPESISYVEAHGTATPMGDPIEVAALTQAFRAGTSKKQFCALGSVKTNVGHLDTAAGVAGLIKTVMALKHEVIPRSLHFEKPNPNIDFVNSPFYVNHKLTEWKANGHPRRAGVSSFGLGGTNAHIIVEEAPPVEESSESRPAQLILLSAKTATALSVAVSKLAAHLREHTDLKLADVAYTLQVGRQHLPHRQMLVSANVDGAVTALETGSLHRAAPLPREQAERPVVFMFPGGGTQYVNMGVELYQREPVFREEVDKCSRMLTPRLGFELRDLFYPAAEDAEQATAKLNQPLTALPSIFIIEYALAKLWMSWGVEPQALIGHSLGEYVAACLAGVFTLEDALSVVVKRGELAKKLPAGAMLGVPLPETEVRDLMGAQLSLAAINGPSQCVVSGSIDDIDRMAERLKAKGVAHKRIRIGGAGHSQAVTLIMDELIEFIRPLDLKPPRIPYISNVTGTWVRAEEATDAAYWARHLRQTVRFADGIGELLRETNRILLEVGPGQTLSTLAKLQTDDAGAKDVISSMRHQHNPQPDMTFLLTTLGQLWLRGARIDWAGFYARERRRRVPLPSYPFERQRYWIEPLRQSSNGHAAAHVQSPAPEMAEIESAEANAPEGSRAPSGESAAYSRPPLQSSYTGARNDAERELVKIWQDLFNIEPIGVNDNFFELGGSSVLTLQLNTRIVESFQTKLSLHAFLEAPTISQLAELMAAQRPPNGSAPPSPTLEPERPSTLVEIQQGQSAQPLALVSPMGGGLFGYRRLAQCLGREQTVYGFHPRGLGSVEAPFTRIADEAAYYVEALRNLQPQGPYFLGGASYGGAVAFEMAQQLRAQDERVALLVLFDTPSPSQSTINSEDEAAIIANVLPLLINADLPLSVSELRQLSTEQRMKFALEQLRRAGVLPPGIDPSQTESVIRVWMANAKAFLGYAPQPYPGRVIYFRAGERTHGQAVFPELAWTEVASGGIEIHVASGNHYTLLSDPHVQSVGERLRLCLYEARGRTDFALK